MHFQMQLVLFIPVFGLFLAVSSAKGLPGDHRGRLRVEEFDGEKIIARSKYTIHNTPVLKKLKSSYFADVAPDGGTGDVGCDDLHAAWMEAVAEVGKANDAYQAAQNEVTAAVSEAIQAKSEYDIKTADYEQCLNEKPDEECQTEKEAMDAAKAVWEAAKKRVEEARKKTGLKLESIDH